MVCFGYKSESGTVWLAMAALAASCVLPRRALFVTVPVWACVSRLVARGARNRARPVNETAGEAVRREARFVMAPTMEPEARPVAIVTGTNSGIGYHTAVELAAEGYIVVITCRSASLTQRTAEQIRHAAEECRRHNARKYAHAPVPVCVDGGRPIECDDFASVRSFAAWFTGKYGGRNVQLLVNNAGAMRPGLCFSRFRPELELHFAVNFLGPFLLTELLLPLLERCGGRVVYVSSEGHRFAQVRLEKRGSLFLQHGPGAKEVCCGVVNNQLCLALQELNKGADKAAGPLADRTVGGAFTRYGVSKLLNIYHAHHIARRYRNAADEAHRVYACALHPGCVATNFSKSLLGFSFLNTIFRGISLLFLKSSEEGAQTTLHCAMCPRAELELVSRGSDGDVITDEKGEKGGVEDEAVSGYFVECANKTRRMLLAYGWDLREAESVVAMARRLVELDVEEH